MPCWKVKCHICAVSTASGWYLENSSKFFSKLEESSNFTKFYHILNIRDFQKGLSSWIGACTLLYVQIFSLNDQSHQTGPAHFCWTKRWDIRGDFHPSVIQLPLSISRVSHRRPFIYHSRDAEADWEWAYFRVYLLNCQRSAKKFPLRSIYSIEEVTSLNAVWSSHSLWQYRWRYFQRQFVNIFPFT
jgi:hypothetical protein